jgi:hypothetical protein
MPHLQKLVIIKHHLVVFIQHDPGELRGQKVSWTLAKIELSLYRMAITWGWVGVTTRNLVPQDSGALAML